jgi:hypothetical protein
MNADDSDESISSNAEEMIIPPSVTINNQQVVGAISGDIDFEIVGLFSSSNGRFCCMHKTCGEHVCVGDVLRLVKTIIVIGTTSEEAIKLVKIIDGTDACTVGFIPRVQANLPKVIGNINKFCQVIELYHTSDSTYKKNKGDKNLGMAGAILLNSIPINE